jgi:transketolase
VSAARIPPETVDQLQAVARQIRQDIIRMTYQAGSGHPGGSLSVTDIVTALVFHELRIDPEHPDWPERDRLVLSKGHAAPALYSALAHRGFFDPKDLLTLREIGSPLQGNVDHRKLPSVEASTGAPGQGLGMAVGMALDARLAKRPSRVYAIIGDGECEAGLTWEALLAGAHYALDNLVVIVDRNEPGLDPSNENRMGLEPLAAKFQSFRYDTLEIDGHSFPAILEGLAHARTAHGRPTVLIARTVKGKGVSFMENQEAWHGKPPNRDEAERALAELGGSL